MSKEKVQATYYFNGKVQISQVPYDYKNLKETIKSLFNLNDQQLSNYIITYKDIDNKEFYIIDEETYKNAQLISEQIVFNIELKENNNQKNNEEEDENEHFIGEENDYNSDGKNQDTNNSKDIYLERRGKGRIRPNTKARYRKNSDREREEEDDFLPLSSRLHATAKTKQNTDINVRQSFKIFLFIFSLLKIYI